MDPSGRPSPRGGGRGRSFDLLSLGSFVVLGIPDGMLGPAWPSMRQSFSAPVGDLGLVLLATTAGAAAVTAVVGPLIRRFGIPALLAVAGVCAAVGATGFALAPGLGVIIGVAVLLGASAGMMDSGLNTAVALSGRRRLLNLLHGAYGAGTAIGPLVVTVALLAGSWRSAYLALVVVDLALATSWVLHRRNRSDSNHGGERAPGGPAPPPPATVAPPHPSERWSRRRSAWVVATGMAVFFLYTGLEVAAGQWEASFCRGELGLSASAAGVATFGYWGALTVVRIVLALIPRPVPPAGVVRWGSVLAVVAAGAIWWQPDVAVSLTGFAVLGAALAGVFPALVSLTPNRLGPRRAQRVISWQVGAAAAGGSTISALVGLLIGATSLAALGPTITALALLLIGGGAVLGRVTRVGAVSPHP